MYVARESHMEGNDIGFLNERLDISSQSEISTC